MLTSKPSRRSIHTGLKILVKCGAVPDHLLQQLNPSQVWKYRHEPKDKYVGCELFDYVLRSEQLINHYNRYAFDKKVINGYMRLAVIVRNVFSSVKHFNKILSGKQEAIVDVIERFGRSVPVKTISRFIGVSYQTVSGWIMRQRTRCSDSLINVCRKYKPSQLLSSEVSKIKSLLTDQQYKYWPVCSVYYYALHNNLLSMSLNTFYKYARLLNIKRLKPLCKKTYGISVRATYPNQYWHADVMKLKTLDGIWNYIYVVVDNFSRKILYLTASGKLSADIRKETFRLSALHALSVDSSPENVKLIVDGGSENVNQTVDEFLNDFTGFNIQRLVALKDVPFSNSLVEAVNKIIRNSHVIHFYFSNQGHVECQSISYLNHFTIENLTQLLENLLWIGEDYNQHRPHGALNGLTPEMAYQKEQLDNELITARIKAMRSERRNMNINSLCSKCQD